MESQTGLVPCPGSSSYKGAGLELEPARPISRALKIGAGRTLCEWALYLGADPREPVTLVLSNSIVLGVPTIQCLG